MTDTPTPVKRTRRPNTPDSNRNATAARGNKALEMHLMGDTYQKIADKLGFADKASAFNAVKRALQMAPECIPDRDLVIRVEAGRLDALQRSQWSQAMSGDVEAAKIVLAVMGRRAKMFGLDAPTRVEQRITTEMDAEIQQMLNEMGDLSKVLDRRP